jgi:hypothetical protein
MGTVALLAGRMTSSVPQQGEAIATRASKTATKPPEVANVFTVKKLPRRRGHNARQSFNLETAFGLEESKRSIRSQLAGQVFARHQR